jgi:hypothetical protein
MEQWLINLFDSKCTSNCSGKCTVCKQHAAGVILKGSAIIGGIIGGSLTLIGQLFTGFDMESFCLITGASAFMLTVCGAAFCVKVGLVDINHVALQDEIKKLQNENYYNARRQENFKSDMYLYEMRMSHYRNFPR